MFQISISYSHTIGTRVRLSLMRSISKRQREKDPNAVCSVSSFTARPMLRVGGGKDKGTRFLSYVDAVLGFRHLLTQEDIDKAASMCQNLRGHLRSRFLVMSDDRVPPPPPSRKRPFLDEEAELHRKRAQIVTGANAVDLSGHLTSFSQQSGPSIFSPSSFPPLPNVSNGSHPVSQLSMPPPSTSQSSFGQVIPHQAHQSFGPIATPQHLVVASNQLTQLRQLPLPAVAQPSGEAFQVVSRGGRRSQRLPPGVQRNVQKKTSSRGAVGQDQVQDQIMDGLTEDLEQISDEMPVNLSDDTYVDA